MDELGILQAQRLGQAYRVIDAAQALNPTTFNLVP